jgi:uncharacterized protein (TIGR00730 family)
MYGHKRIMVASSAPRAAEMRDSLSTVRRGWWSLIQPSYRGILAANHPLAVRQLCFPARLDDAAGAMHIHAMNRNEKVSKIRTICVYCGSSPGTDPAFAEAAVAFGAILANNGIRLVFGGGAVGIMGAIAKSVLDHGGKVTGIIPEFLVVREHAMRGADNLIVTRDMHERKRKMFEMADAFVALPGGIGTLEEVVEQITWVQLGRHRKPILLANIKGFWNPLCALIDHMKKLEFIRGDLDFDLLVANNVADILPMLQKAAAAVPEEEKEMPAVIADRL